MFFSKIEFHEALLECEFDPSQIEKVIYAWGEETDPWNGGFCFKTFDKDYYRLIRYSDGSTILEQDDQRLKPTTEDYESSPADLQQWLEGGEPEDDPLAF